MLIFLLGVRLICLGWMRSVVVHCLDACPNCEPVKQRPRIFALEQQEAIDVEVEKLLATDIIFKIKYPQWLTNVVMVKKPNGK